MIKLMWHNAELTFGGLVLGAVAVVAAQAGVQRAAEALVVQDGERVEADARLVVELPAVGHVAAAHRPIRTLALEARVEAWWRGGVQGRWGWREVSGESESLQQVRAGGEEKSEEKGKKREKRSEKSKKKKSDKKKSDKKGRRKRRGRRGKRRRARRK